MFPDPSLPIDLARLHRDTTVGAVVPVSDGDDLPGWLIEGAGFEPAGAASLTRLRTLPDWVGPGMRLLVCGLNPSLVAADARFGYAGPTNRFWPAAVASGLVSRARDPEHALTIDGVGMTDLVKRATPGAAELTAAEYRAGADRVRQLAGWLRPRAVVFVGLAGWRAAVDRRAVTGWQAAPFGGVPTYVMPSTSGLNAHSTLGVLTAHLAAAQEAPPLP